MSDFKENKYQTIFTNNLVHYVELSGKQQKEIAKDINIPIQTFNGWCNGVSMPNMDKIQILADYFHIRKYNLLDNITENSESSLNTKGSNMNLGETLKQLRIQNKLTVDSVSEYMTNKGFKALTKTIYSWENNTSTPHVGAFLCLCDLYNVTNVLNTFGYELENSSVTYSEYEIIKKIRALDKYGIDIVNLTINHEYLRCREQKK